METMFKDGSKPGDQVVDSRSADVIAAGMRGVVLRGSGTALSKIGVPVSGKTGTAQTGAKEPNSWFTGFTMTDPSKQIAFAAIVERGGYGATAAAPLSAMAIEIALQRGLVTGGK